MHAYVITTGIVFMLLFAVHVARIAFEGWHVLGDFFFSLSTVIAAVLAGWAAGLLLRRRRRAA